MAPGTNRRWSSASSRSWAQLIERTKPDLVVIACNTASTLALAALREQYTVPFVGTVPAIKPAAAQTKSGIIGVLATPGTVKREYTHALIHTYAYHCKVFLHGAKRLAEIAEAKLKGQRRSMTNCETRSRRYSASATASMTDVVVLACTHYPLLLDEIRKRRTLAGDLYRSGPCHRAARQRPFPHGHDQWRRVKGAPGGIVFLTSARGRGSESLAAYAAMGFAANEVLDLPV